MISLVLSNRNRTLEIVERCLNSLSNQSDPEFEWFLVDYGSKPDYFKKLKRLASKYPTIRLIDCPTSGQLWNKSRAINIALKRATQPYFVVGDIDFIFHQDYIKTLKLLAKPNEIRYFQCGFIDKKNTAKYTNFNDFPIAFVSTKEATGNTLFPREALCSINGFDEFYHGWGAEDTDVHIRMSHIGMKIKHFDKKILIKHQWHPKSYRKEKSKQPFHDQLEEINHAYMQQTKLLKRTLVNLRSEWGKSTDHETYGQLKKPSKCLSLLTSKREIKALIAQFNNFSNEMLEVKIVMPTKKIVLKHKIKKILGKKHSIFYSMKVVNNLLLDEIIKNYRNCPYNICFDREKKTITLNIYFPRWKF